MMVQGFVSTILDAQVACILCGSPDDSMIHRIYDCPCVPSIPRTWTGLIALLHEAREKAHTCPIFWFRGLPPSVAGTLSCQSPMTPLLRILARWTSWVVTYSLTGAGELRPETTASAAVALVSRGSFRMVACLARWEEELAYYMAETNQWQEPNSSQQLKPSNWPGKLRSRFSSGPIVCSSINGFARGRRWKHLSHADLWEEFWKAHDAIGTP